MKNYLIIIIAFLSTCAYAQQESMYTQFMFNKMDINPAYAGHDNYTHLNLIYRNQWNGFEGAPNTIQLSGNLAGFNNGVGVGAILRKRSIGITDLISLSGMYSYSFEVESGILSLGIETTGKRYSVDFTDPRLIAIEGLDDDPSIPDGIVSKTILNVGFGVYYHSEEFYISASATNIMNADLDFDTNSDLSKEVLQVQFMGGYEFTINESLKLTPQFTLRYVDNAPVTTDLNIMATLYDYYFGGLNYRTGGRNSDIGESIGVIAGLHISDELLLSLAYDIQLSGLRSFNNGSFELMLGYRIPSKNSGVNMVNPRYF